MSVRMLRNLVPGTLNESRLSPEVRAELIAWREELAGIRPPELPEGAKRVVVVPIYEPMGSSVYPITEWPPQMEFMESLFKVKS